MGTWSGYMQLPVLWHIIGSSTFPKGMNWYDYYCIVFILLDWKEFKEVYTAEQKICERPAKETKLKHK